MSIAHVGTNRLGVYVVPFCQHLLSTESITINSCRCLFLFARRRNDSMLLWCGRKLKSSVDRRRTPFISLLSLSLSLSLSPDFHHANKLMQF